MSCVTLGICIFRNVEAAYAHLVRGISPISEAYYSAYKKYNNISNSNYILDYSNLNKIGINKYLSLKDYVALSDVESYNTWIEFRKTNEEVMVSIVKAEKEEGSHDIEFNLKEPIAGEWEKQVIRYSQLKTEIIEKLGEYVEFITISNTEHPEIEKIDELLKGFQKCDF